MFLPIQAAVEDQKRPAASSAVAASAEASPLDGLRLLVVEDEEDSRVMLKRALSSAGAAVTTAADAESALREIDENSQFDAIISDIGMPGMSGYDLARRVRGGDASKAAATIPMLALTAYARTEDRAAALEAGFDDHVAKPIDHGELRQRIRRLLTASSRH